MDDFQACDNLRVSTNVSVSVSVNRNAVTKEMIELFTCRTGVHTPRERQTFSLLMLQTCYARLVKLIGHA